MSILRISWALLWTTLLLTLGCSSATRTATSRDAYRLMIRPGAPVGELVLGVGQLLDTRVGESIRFGQLIARLRRAQVVFIGEQHNNLAHHRLQARIIGALSQTESLTVGLEMLPRQTQPLLDAYVQGRLTERAFLEQVRWYVHWGFDFRYYQPIFHLARQRKLRLLALNAPNRVVRQVGRRGLAALTPAQRRGLPPVFLGSKPHRRLFAALLGPHHSRHRGMFERFYQAQSLRDETMADSVRRAFSGDKPPPRMVVIAGAGHLVYRLGINLRLHRSAPHLKQLTIVPVALKHNQRRLSRQLGDFLIATAPPSRPFPTLGVQLVTRDSKLLVKRLAIGRSRARKAGVRAGDQLLRADGKAVKTAFDLRWILQHKRRGESIRLEIQRGQRRLQITVNLD